MDTLPGLTAVVTAQCAGTPDRQVVHLQATPCLAVDYTSMGGGATPGFSHLLQHGELRDAVLSEAVKRPRRRRTTVT